MNGNTVTTNGTSGTNGYTAKPEPAKTKTDINKLDGNLKAHNADWRIHGSMVGLDGKALSALYDNFADEYEKAYNHVGYEGPDNVAKALLDNMPAGTTPATVKVFDAGCGTGMIGAALVKAGVKELHGVDFSAGMLKFAAEKKIYTSLTEADLMKPLKFDSDRFDAVVSCGVFTAGHVSKTALLELIRITRPGGILSIGSQELVYESEGYPAFIADLEAKKAVKKIEHRTVYTMNKSKTEMTVLILEVC